MHVEESTFNR